MDENYDDHCSVDGEDYYRGPNSYFFFYNGHISQIAVPNFFKRSYVSLILIRGTDGHEAMDVSIFLCPRPLCYILVFVLVKDVFSLPSLLILLLVLLLLLRFFFLFFSPLSSIL